MLQLKRASILLLASVAVAACPDHPPPLTGPSNPVNITVSGTVKDISAAPISGVSVRVTANTSVQRATDASGHYEMPPVEYTKGTFEVVAEKPGYMTTTWLATPNAANIVVNFTLAQLFDLPIDGTVTAELGPNDPADWVGDPYDSDYSSNTKYYRYSTLSTDVTVELTWEHAGNADFRLWAQNGTLMSQASGNRQVLQLPRNSSGILLVSQTWDAGKLLQSTQFTLETKRIGG